MIQKIVVATRNAGKLAEFSRMFGDLNVILIPLPADAPIVVEDGQTFLENARKKAISACLWSGMTALADDSGLEVFALGGKPGVFSARFAGLTATDRMNNERLLQLMANVQEADRGAQYVAALALAIPNEETTYVTTGCCQGMIAREPDGSGGFGYDPIFVAPSLQCTMAKATASAKDGISHRGRALQAMIPIIKAHIGS